MNPENVALVIALGIIIILFLVPRRRHRLDELEENARRVQKERLERMQK